MRWSRSHDAAGFACTAFIELASGLATGLSLVAGTMLMYPMTRFAAGRGATLMLSELLGSAISVIIFFRQFDEPLRE